ncbi:MAG: hypothetical protein ACR2QM_06150 [Longimicrobiales bacterium]
MVRDQPADSGTVVLHRVGTDFAGQLDSVPVRPDGRFTIDLPPVDDEARSAQVLFASIRHEGILYFGAPINTAAVADSAYVIQAYPSFPVAPGTMVPVRIRNLFVEVTDSGWVVTDLYELSNIASSTLVAPPGGSSWSHRLPTGATDFSVGQSDLPEDEVRFDEGVLATTVPIPPDESVFVIRYRVTEDALVIPSDSPTESFELLIREPAPEVAVTGLARMDQVDVDGTTYRRFAGNGLPPTVVRVAPGQLWTPAGAIPWLGAILAIILALIGAKVATKRGGSRTTAQVMLEIARLDEERSAGRIGDEEYDARRSELVERLELIGRSRPTA